MTHFMAFHIGLYCLQEICEGVSSLLHRILSIKHIKGDSNPNDKYVLSERALWTMNFDTSIIKIGWKMGKLWAFKEFNMANI